MHNQLLRRQIAKFFPQPDAIPEQLRPFVDMISSSYDQFEADRRMIERAMDVSSQELLEVNLRLLNQSERQRLVLEKLTETLNAVDTGAQIDHELTGSDDDLLEITHVLHNVVDKSNEAKERLRESEELFRLITEHASDLIVRYNASGSCTYISPSCRSLLGYAQEELLGKTVFEVMHSDDVRPIALALNRALRQESAFTLSARIRRRDGVYRWFETAIKALRDEATGSVTEFHTSARDITKRKEAEERLRETTSRLSALVENLEAGVLVIDANQRIVIINTMFCRMFNLAVAPADVIGEHSSAVSADSMRSFEDPVDVMDRAQNIMAERVPVVGEEVAMVDGRAIERDYIPVFIDGTFESQIWYCRDITERRRAEEAVRLLNAELRGANEKLRIERDREKEHVRALEELNAMKNEFVSSVSHELRTPLASIIGFAQTMMIDPDITADVRAEFLGIIYGEGKRLAKLIDDLLDTARIESGRITVERRRTDLVPLVDRAVQSIAQQAAAKRIVVTTETATPTIQATVDPDRIAQVVMNLLGNAVKFTPEDGHVDVRMNATDAEIRFSVRDSGMGIPEVDLPHIFEKFYRVHRPGLEIRGTGLGLAIVRQLVEMHDGIIEVQSEVGRGSTFTVCLPR